MKKQHAIGGRGKKGKFVRFGETVLAELRAHADRESRNVQGQIVYYVLRGLEKDRDKLKVAS